MSLSSAPAETSLTQPDPPTVLIFHPLLAGDQNSLEQKFRFLKPWESPLSTNDFLSANADSIRVVLTHGPRPRVDAELMDRLPKLECIVATSAGVNHIDMPECRKRGVVVCNSGDAFSDDVADYAVGLLIDVLRRISAGDRFVRKGVWPVQGEFPLGYMLGGKRVGIVGLGNIGSRIAKRLVAFGCIISYHSRTQKKYSSYKYFSSVYDLAADSDVLIISCVLSSATHHIINKEVMLALGKEGIIINIGRGMLIDEKELVKCLVGGEIGGAGLDVFENEPMVPEELFQMDNVVLSHHSAVFTPESFSSLLQVVTDNLEAFFSNKPLCTPFSD